MRTIPSRLLVAAAAVLALAVPVALHAQSSAPGASAPGASPPAAAPPGASAPGAAAPPAGATQAAPRAVMSRVEARIKRLHAELHITAAQKPQWDGFAQVMRENAADMSQAFARRAAQQPTMTAVQSLQSYEQLAAEHVDRLKRLIPAFEALYNAMSPPQKQAADRIFARRALRHARTRAH